MVQPVLSSDLVKYTRLALTHSPALFIEQKEVQDSNRHFYGVSEHILKALVVTF